MAYQEADEILTLLEDIYADSPEEKYVGFIIEKARTFCSKHGQVAVNGTVKLVEILDTLAIVFPSSLEKQNIARKILSDAGLNVVELTNADS